MPHYWVRLKPSLATGTVDADTEEAARVAVRIAKNSDSEVLGTLPYPAAPYWVAKKHKYPDGREFTIPTFCYRPHKCLNNSYCRTNPACTE